MAPLPRIDEHAVEVAAPRHEVWAAVERSLPRIASGPGASAVTRILGCRDVDTTVTTPAKVGATIPGFRVANVRPPALVSLEGRHRFSEYRLTFHIDELGPERSQLRAETHAAFPGPHGRIYRALVIGTRGHVLAVRRMLQAIKRRAERRQPA